MDEKGFYSAVDNYRQKAGKAKGKSVLITFPLENEDAYYSIAPLSMALHEIGADLNVICYDIHSDVLESLLKAWQLYRSYVDKEKTKAVKSLGDFIKTAEHKAGKGKIERLFKAPDMILRAGRNGFVGSMDLGYDMKWLKKRRFPSLLKTADVVWHQVYDLKASERAAIGFELLPAKKSLDKPLRDYLDSYVISEAMYLSAKKIALSATMSASSSRDSMIESMERIADLKATLLGCELSKKINEPVFKKFLPVSRYLGTSKMQSASAFFFISGKGYPGAHIFGQKIGYPTPNRKSRWQSPGGIIYKFTYAPQSKHEERLPKARVAFTETIPIELFIKTCNIDWFMVKRKNDALKDVAAKSVRFVVRSGTSAKNRTQFEVGIIKKDGTPRWAKGSDISTRTLINEDYYKKTGIKAGNMSNLPGGEMFITPEYVEGTIVGDVVVSVDQSYRLSEKKPLIIRSDKKGYKIVSGQKKIVDLIEKKKKESWHLLKKQEGVLPKELVDLKKKNFNLIGEFAINTNPKAELCDYLIVNEKIAGMIHIALGSGFEDDRATEYHYDIVVDAKRQKLDIYGEDDKRNKHWVMKKGRLMVG